jgi:hypothetical protein
MVSVWRARRFTSCPPYDLPLVRHTLHLAYHQERWGDIDMTVAPHDVVVATHDTAAALHDLRDRQRFIKSLTEAIAWCTGSDSLSDPGASLRTCKPKYLVSPEDQLNSVCTSRSLGLPESARRGPAVTGLCGGRLVAYIPSFNLDDGVAEAESNGFFDVNNIPPCDTWVWMVQCVSYKEYADRTTSEMETSYLVAWVPPDFIALADAGIRANPESCIRWFEELDDDFVLSLRSMNFLPTAPVEKSAPGVEHT